MKDLVQPIICVTEATRVVHTWRGTYWNSPSYFNGKRRFWPDVRTYMELRDLG